MNLANLTIIEFVNIIATLAVFFYSANRLSAKQWTVKQPELWVHSMLVGTSLQVVLVNAWDVVAWKQLSEVLLNITVAIYLGVRAWRKKQQNKMKLKFKPPEPTHFMNLSRSKK